MLALILLLAQAPYFGGLEAIPNLPSAIVTVSPSNPKPGERVKVKIDDAERVDVVGSIDEKRLAVARAQVRWYALQARRAAIIQQIEAEMAKAQQDFDAAVKALPGYKPGCDADEQQNLKCPDAPKEGVK